MGHPDSTCWTLVQGAAQGNGADREAFAVRYGPVIRAYLASRWHLPPDHDAVIDGAQEVFLQCFRPEGALERLDPSRAGGFRAYLFGIARNVAAGTERRFHQEASLNDRAALERDLPSEGDDTLSDAFDRAWARMITHEARDLMADRARSAKGDSKGIRYQALELRYHGGMPAREVARALGMSPGAAYIALTRARREFREALIDIMATYHPEEAAEKLEARCVELLALL